MKTSPMEVQMAVIRENLEQNTREHKELKEAIAKIDIKLDMAVTEKVDKTEFAWWRTLLVSGILLSIFLMVLSIIITK